MDLRRHKIFVDIKNPQRCFYNHFPNGYESLIINNMDDVDGLNIVLSAWTHNYDAEFLQPNDIQCFAMENTLVLDKNGDFSELSTGWFDAYLTLHVIGIVIDNDVARLKTRVHKITLTDI